MIRAGHRVGFAMAKAKILLSACSLGCFLTSVSSVLSPGISELISLFGYHSWSELSNTVAQRRVHRRGGGLVRPEPDCRENSDAHWAGKKSGVSRNFLRAKGLSFILCVVGATEGF